MIKYAIIENEYFALQSLKKLVEQIRPMYNLVFSAESVEETVLFFSQDKDVELIFMDIELVDGNCFDIFRRIKIDIPIIFTTAYNDYAIQAFKVNSVDYILKPVSERQITEALDKFEKYSITSRPVIDYRILSEVIAEKKTKKRVLINKGDNYSYIDTGDVAYFYSEDKYVFLKTFADKRHITMYANLNQVENDLDYDKFFRVARNMVVHIKAVLNVCKYYNGRLKVTIKVGDKNVDAVVSSAKREQFLKWLGGE